MTRTRSTSILFLAILWIAPCVSLRADNPRVGATTPAAVPPAYLPGFRAIEEADLRAWISFLAAPELAGRESGRPGFDVAARFAASMLQRFGVQPAGDRREDRVSYFQAFDLARLVQKTDETFLRLERAGKTESFQLGADFRIRGRQADIDWKGPWVLVDLAARGEEIDVRKKLEESGLSDHIPIVLTRTDQFNVAKLGLTRPPEGRALIICDREERRARGPVRGRATLPSRLRTRFGNEAQIIYLKSQVADRLLASLGTSVARRRKVEPGDAISVTGLDDLRMHISAKTIREPAPTRNVLGLIEGSDPELRDEYVCIGAHLDHVGKDHDAIFFGADDNASGSSGVLAIAGAIARSPHRPRRSVLLALWGAEELGMLGSGYFVANPPVPLEKIVTYINLDMIGRDEESDAEKAEDNRDVVHVVGSSKRSTQLHDFIESCNRMVGLRIEEDEERVFRRSDQFQFDRNKIPTAFFFTGFHRDYHRPTDTIEKLNYAKLTRIVRLAYLVVHGLADLDERPARVRRERF